MAVNLPFVNLNTILVFIVYSLNFLLFVGAIATIYVCLSEQRQKDIIENIDINFEFLVIFCQTLIIVAIVIALVSFLGCIGIVIDNDYMLIAYIIIIGILMAAEIFLSTYLSHKLSNSEEEIRKKILSIIKTHTTDNAKKLDGFQTKYQCCGIESYKDWIDKEHGIGYIPGTCCNKKSNETCAEQAVYSTKGCKKAIMDEISSMLKHSIYIIFVVFFLEVILAVCSILIIMDIGQPNEDNTSDEIVVVASLKKKLSPNKEREMFKESIDTHDSHHLHRESIQSPVAKIDEIGLYDEEKTIQKAQEDEIEDEESHEEENDAGGRMAAMENEDYIYDDEEIITGDVSKDEVSDEENPEDEFHDDAAEEPDKIQERQRLRLKTRKTSDEEIYLEGNLDTKNHEEKGNIERHIGKRKKEKSKYVKKHNTSVKKKEGSVLQKPKPIQKKQEEKAEEEEAEEEGEEEEEDERLAIVNQTKLEENIHVSKSKQFAKKKYGEKVQKERIRDRKRFK